MKRASGFGDVDASGEVERLATYLQTVSAEASVADGKRARDALLGLCPGDHVLEVGCGLGDDAARLVACVGGTGGVVGVDASEALLERAAARHVGVQWVRGDAHALPFAADTFAAARVERTLQHLRDPASAVGEMVRVVRPGGVVLAAEPDWATIAISGADQRAVDATQRVVETAIRHARVGRMLPGLLVAAGVRGVEVRVEPLLLRTWAHMDEVFDVAAVIAGTIDGGLLTSERAEAFSAAMQEDARTGRLLVCLTLVVAWGTVDGAA